MLVGLTGGIGSGKSEVARRLRDCGAVVVDMDALARSALAPGTPAAGAVVAEFGASLLDRSGAIDRARLAALVFTDPDARRRLEAIVHPEVRRRAAEATAAAPAGSVVVHEVPLLVESRLAANYDAVVVVTASEANRVRRLVAGRGMSEGDARARIAAQASEEARRSAADFLIANDDSVVELDGRVKQLWSALVDRANRSDPPQTTG